ncbi:PIG-L deacetylase family protein [Nostoc sp. UHCC 0870]|uniref:PIG-L deacetylase family protein n=1 Tax=Nostoc sp. UHCC 0870 TaxID=2914041 RepID=UPI001EE142E1|nr:PIG-L family deacetylase [Nostoc sp. UHCC 0870]UKO97961.1 PIG-L family deacetylase [Nostoc sp. UHCC 0870]
MVKIKNYLQELQKSIPNQWLEKVQYLHSDLLWRWLVFSGSEAIALSQKSAMVFSPHQDDETFGCGGMIAHKREKGIQVVVVFLTNGAGGDNLNPDLQNQIILTRKQEAVTALQILGVEVSDIYFLDKPDGHLQNLIAEERQQTIKQIAELLRLYQPEEVYIPHSKDCHRDHEATFPLVKAGINEANIKPELLQYAIWLFWRSPLFIILKLQDLAAAYRVSITSVQEKKKLAIASYSSQLASLPQGFVKQFLSSYEIFFKTQI